MAGNGSTGKKRDKYPGVRGALEREFGSVRGFSKEAGICHSIVTRVIQGDRKESRPRIEDAIRRLRPEVDLSGIWRRGPAPAPSERALRQRLRESRARAFGETEEERHI